MSKISTEQFNPDIFLDTHELYLDDKVYQVNGTGTLEFPSEGVVLFRVDFEDPALAEKSELLSIKLEPGATYESLKITGDDVCIAVVENGFGEWLGSDPEGNIVKRQLAADDRGHNRMIYSKNWVGTWLASEEGLEILEMRVARELLENEE